MVSLRFRDGNILQKKDTIRLGLDGSYLIRIGGSLLSFTLLEGLFSRRRRDVLTSLDFRWSAKWKVGSDLHCSGFWFFIPLMEVSLGDQKNRRVRQKRHGMSQPR